MALTYKKAGVDISKIKQSQNTIGKIIESTHKLQKKVRIVHGFGHYAGIVEIPGKTLLATHTDGVGTKVLIANMMKKFDTVGIDCVAMNVNDIICIGATPISFVDYIAVNKNDKAALKKIVQGLVKGAKKANVPIVGGETAIMPDVISGNHFSFDLAGMVVGMLTKKQMILGNKIKLGDVIIGVQSSGLHSNGYSLARKALLSKYSLQDRIKGIGKLGNALLTPTQVYVKPVLGVLEKCKVHGMAHITGGSFTKLLRLKKTGYMLDQMPTPLPIFQIIENEGVSRQEMYKTFNMGIGFCVIAPKNEEGQINSTFKKFGMKSKRVGKIIAKKGVFVNSLKLA
ncbi:MAG: Phosphoribosylformylglycinamidine cyclo-ligase [Nitrosopumilales archaeon]|nr:MAG: Phosphoribosylformylglycinamidine cyclo-ligase [Nitrosopumilales archaeon]